MAEGILRPPPSTDLNSGSAGIFVERSGNRKMSMGGGRLVLPRLFGKNNRPIVEGGDVDILRRNGADQSIGAYVPGSSSSDPAVTQEVMQPKQASSFVTCSQCGTSQEWLQDGPFHCPYCEIQKSGDIVMPSDLPRDLHPVEEGDHSELEEDTNTTLEGHRTPTRSHSPTMRHSPDPQQSQQQILESRPETPSSGGTVRRLSNLVRRISGGSRSRSGSAEKAFPDTGYD